MKNIQDYSRAVIALQAGRSILRERLAREQDAFEEARKDIEDLGKAQALFQQAALETQATLRVRLTAIGKTALGSVFPDKNLSFTAEFETKRGKTECALLVGEEGEYTEPMEGHGGGVVDVLSFALRVAFWSMDRSRPVLVLDEPFKFLSRDLVPAAANIIHRIARELKLQIIMVSHIPEFIEVADNVVSIERRDGASFIKQGLVHETRKSIPSDIDSVPLRGRPSQIEGGRGREGLIHRRIPRKISE